MLYRSGMATSYGERLAQAMELANLRGPDARTKLAKAVGVSVQAIGQLLNGKSKNFSAESSARAARFLKVDSYWLATGDGEPRSAKLSDDALAFAKLYDELDERERERWQLLVQVARNGVPDAPERRAPAAAKPPAHQREKERH